MRRGTAAAAPCHHLEHAMMTFLSRIRMRGRRSSPSRGMPFLAFAALMLALVATPVGAQPSATVSVNSWLCPAGYDQISDCLKIGDVTVAITADGVPVGEVTTTAAASADLAVPVDAEIAVTILGGAPEGTLEPATLTFTAVEGTNPVTLVWFEAAPVDTDGDGLTDRDEAALGTDPAVYDTDSDGVGDGGEVNAGTDPLNPDTDGDGYTDREELDRQSDPLDPTSIPAMPALNAITITAYDCPGGYDGKDLFEDCAAPAAGVDFTVSLDASEFGVTQTTDGAGMVSFTDLGSGTYSVHEDLDDLDGPLERISVVCFGEPFAPGAPEPRQIAFTYQDESGFGLLLEQISCTWFNIPAADAPPTPTATSTPTPKATAPVVKLPKTGTGTAVEETSDDAQFLLVAAAVVALLGTGTSVSKRR
jgi:hypothetical protein